MAINPLTNSIPGLLNGVQRPQGDAARARVEQGYGRAVTGPAAPAAQRAGAVSIAQTAQPSLPAQPPTGTDPELWAVLTGEERTFFAKLGAMGPLTYSRVMTTPNAPPTVRGGRLDIKV
jgi:hypothetical protein